MDILEKEQKIIVTKDKASRKPIVKVEGLWTGRDRLIIYTHLKKAMRKAANEYIKARKQADLEKAAKQNIKKEEKEKWTKTKPKKKTKPRKKKLLMKKVKR